MLFVTSVLLRCSVRFCTCPLLLNYFDISTTKRFLYSTRARDSSNGVLLEELHDEISNDGAYRTAYWRAHYIFSKKYAPNHTVQFKCIFWVQFISGFTSPAHSQSFVTSTVLRKTSANVYKVTPWSDLDERISGFLTEVIQSQLYSGPKMVATMLQRKA